MLFFFFFFKQQTAYELLAWLEFRRVLFRSIEYSAAGKTLNSLCYAPNSAYWSLFFLTFSKTILSTHQGMLRIKVFYASNPEFLFLFSNFCWESGRARQTLTLTESRIILILRACVLTMRSWSIKRSRAYQNKLTYKAFECLAYSNKFSRDLKIPVLHLTVIRKTCFM